MVTKPVRDQSPNAKRRKVQGKLRLLVALLLLGLAAGLLWAARAPVALADLLSQGASTNTPDPNSPLPTPTPTWTLVPTDTPTLVVTPSDTPVLLPTDTPFIFPTDTPFVFPTDTPLAPPIDAPTPPMPTPEPILPPPALPPTSSQPITVPLDAILVIPPPGEETAPAEEETDQRRLDLALFIDNLVIAFGYVWMCFGALALIGAALGGVWLWRRRSRPPAQPVPNPERPAPQPPTASPVQSPPTAPAPASTRVAARRRSSPPPNLD